LVKEAGKCNIGEDQLTTNARTTQATLGAAIPEWRQMSVSDILEEEVMEEIRLQTDAVKQIATDIRAQTPLVTPDTLGALNRQPSRRIMNVERPLALRMKDAASIDIFGSNLASMGGLGKWKRIDGEGNEAGGQSRTKSRKTSSDVGR
jgi:hypothetical protein